MATEETPKPPTQRQVIDHMAAAVADLHSEMDNRAAAKQPARQYTETDALARCIDALAELQTAEEQRSRYATAGPYRSWPSGDRVLRFLADRFSVDLIERRTEPCTRRHLDEASQQELVESLQRWPVTFNPS